MKLTQICIERPVLAIVLNVVLIIFGLLAFKNLSTRYLPSITKPVILINTNYPGASAQLVETTITNILEQQLTDVSGVDTIRSESRFGQSYINVKLKLGTNIQQALNQVRAAVSKAQGDFPENIKPPYIHLHDQSASQLVEFAAVDANKSLSQIRDYIDRYIAPELQAINGVSEVDVAGAGQYAMRIWLDPEKMASKHISIDQVVTALENNNIELPAGKIQSKDMDYPITAITRLKTAKQFDDLVIANSHSGLIHLRDIGYAQLSTQDNQVIVRVNGRPAIDVSIYANSDANQIATYNKLEEKIKQLKQQMPYGMHLINAFGVVPFLQASIHEVYFSIIAAVVCVLLVIFLFLGSWRSVLIPVVTIPICLIASFIFVLLFGFSINTLSLLALVLAVGLVVDDAIVMLENIHRYIDSGMSAKAAAIKGSKEIAYPIIVMTLTLVAVYLPLGFLKGFTAILFKQFAFTLAASVVVSGFVSLTLSPMMCAGLLLPANKENRFSSKINKISQHMTELYQRLLNKALKQRVMIIIGVCIIVCIGGWLYHNLHRQLVPRDSVGVVGSFIQSPTGTNVDYVLPIAKKVSKIFRSYSQHAVVFMFAGFNGGNAFVNMLLNKATQKHINTQTIADRLKLKLDQIPGANIYVFVPSFFHSSKNYDVSFYVLSNDPYATINQQVKKLIKKLKKYPGLLNIGSSMQFDSQQFNAQIDTALASDLGVSARQIDLALAIFLGGQNVTNFIYKGQNYQVIIQALAKYLKSPSAISHFYIKSDSGQMINLASLVKLLPTIKQPVLPHFNRLRATQVSASIKPGYTMGQVVNYLQAHLNQYLPSNYQYAFTGMARNLLHTKHDMSVIFTMALVLIFLVLSAQFESFIDPLIILLTVPFSVIGALFALWLTHGSLNLYTDIGLVTLIGLITKHGILITQFANQRLALGDPVMQAVVHAASIRLRPILMTTAAMVLGAVPLAFAQGSGSASRQQLGWVIIGGMLCGTFFSLILVPIAYSYLAKLKYNLSTKKH